MPMFVMREINRNAKDFIKAVKPVYMDKFLNQIAIYLQSAMDKGDINMVPLRIVFNTILWALCHSHFFEQGSDIYGIR
mgnify:CR=1 FL=1